MPETLLLFGCFVTTPLAIGLNRLDPRGRGAWVAERVHHGAGAAAIRNCLLGTWRGRTAYH